MIVPSRQNFQNAFNAPVTHTFPSDKVWATGRKSVYREIFFQDRALICMQQRQLEPGEPVREAAAAKEAGLDQYVFAYLGAHDPYYGKALHGVTYPFGIFLSSTIEHLPICVGTRRDLASPEVSHPFADEFLMAKDARRMAAFETANDARHRADFWRYWGSSKYMHESDYLEKQWQWKIELHYENRVPVTKISAILWPFEVTPGTKGGILPSQLEIDAEEFIQQTPGCAVIPYECNINTAAVDFVRSSCAVVHYLLAFRRYPEDAQSAIEVFADEL